MNHHSVAASYYRESHQFPFYSTYYNVQVDDDDVARRGLLLQMHYHGLPVGLLQSRALHKWLNLRAAVWVLVSGAPKEPRIRWDPG